MRHPSLHATQAECFKIITKRVFLQLPPATAKPFKNLAKMNILLTKSAAGRAHSRSSPCPHQAPAPFDLHFWN